jgi:hypothetical protein
LQSWHHVLHSAFYQDAIDQTETLSIFRYRS